MAYTFRQKILFLLLSALLGLWLIHTSHQHFKKHDLYNYRAAIFGDKAGYYIYLPMAFIYGFNTENLDDDLTQKFGYGFQLDEGLVKTKYTSGVAILTFPVFLLIHLFALLFGFPADGFSSIYFNLPVISGPLYALLGLIFLHFFLRKYFNMLLASLIPLILFFTTNAFHYATVEAFMSHIYSFSMVALFLWMMKANIDSGFSIWKFKVILAFSMGMILLIRPTNALILLLLLCWDVDGLNAFKQRLSQLFTLRNIVLLLTVVFICFLPQLLYWRYAFGAWLPYTYSGESFDYLTNPQIIPILFAPENGMLPYAPFFGVLLICLLVSFFLKPCCRNNLYLGVVFLSALYVISSWGSFVYGCSFGSRPLIDYIPLFALPLGSTIGYLNRKRLRWSLALLGIAIIYSGYFTKNIAKPHDGCFYGSLWQWRAHKNYIDKAGIFPFASNSWKIQNTFEPDQADFYHGNENVKQVAGARSGNFVAFTAPGMAFSAGITAKLFDISLLNIKRLEATIFVQPIETYDGGMLVCQVSLDDETVFWESVPTAGLQLRENEWTEISHTFHLPSLHNQSILKCFFWAPGMDRFLLDDLEVVFYYE